MSRRMSRSVIVIMSFLPRLMSPFQHESSLVLFAWVRSQLSGVRRPPHLPTRAARDERHRINEPAALHEPG